jgi:hypothetical protein
VNTEAGSSRPGRPRLIAARVLTILAVLVAFVGMLAFAVERTLLDESGVERIAMDLIQDDAIREQVALIAVEQLYANVDVEQVIAAKRSSASIPSANSRRASEPLRPTPRSRSHSRFSGSVYSGP